ncbi:MAG TPA: NADH-quinone oxidoreductase subunit C [Bryobacteraceae bacterium]|nr:NADH-quinone oxidoreductase subunit C [Bryobacteraceae bacterium]
MLPEFLRERPVALAVEAFDADAVTGGKFDRNELTLEIAPAKISSVCGFLKYDQKFVRLSTVTAVDRYPAEPRFEVVYHLHSIERKERIRLKCRIGGANPEIESVTSVWAGANWYEREVFDLFGVRFLNHPDPRRIMMPDDWEGHPLRKDYPITGTRV